MLNRWTIEDMTFVGLGVSQTMEVFFHAQAKHRLLAEFSGLEERHVFMYMYTTTESHSR